MSDFRKTHSSSNAPLRAALLGGAAVGALVTGLLVAQAPAQADIGLVKGGRGTAYVTILGGYQRRDGGAAVAPAAPDEVNPITSGVEIEAWGTVTPDRSEAQARARLRDRSANGSASATLDSVTAEGSVKQVIGERQGAASAKTTASAGGSADASNAASLQDGVNDVSAQVATSGTIGNPSSVQQSAQSDLNGNIVPDADSDTGDPASAMTDASQVSGAVAANPVGGAVTADNAVPSLVAAGTSQVLNGAGIVTNANNIAQIFPGVVTQVVSNTQSQIFGLTNAAEGNGIAVIAPEAFVAQATASVFPQETIVVDARYDRVAQAPSVSFFGATLDDTIVPDLANQNLEAEDGAFGGGTLGYVFVSPALGLIDRAEAYVTRARNEDDKGERSFVFEGISADGQAIAAAINTNGLEIQTREVLTQTELGLRFKSDGMAQGPVPLIVSLEPFYMRYEQEARYGVDYLAQFDASVEADLWGGQIALESEVPLFGEAISWVGRVSGGVYYMDADGRYSNSLSGKTLAPGEEETGYRLGAETGLRVFLGPNAYLTGTGAVDHLSEAPFAVFRDGLEGAPSYVGTDELTQYRANLRLTMSTQLHRAEAVAFK